MLQTFHNVRWRQQIYPVHTLAANLARVIEKFTARMRKSCVGRDEQQESLQ